LPLDAPSCKLRGSVVANVDRWRSFSSTHVYESVSKYLLGFPGVRTSSVAHEIIDFVEEELPDLVDHLFMLPLNSPQYKHFCRLIDRRMDKIQFKWTIAANGLKVATEVKHETARHDPDLTEWQRAYHTVNARSQNQQGFQAPAQAGATGDSGKKSSTKH
jgi:hypothetical protein